MFKKILLVLFIIFFAVWIAVAYLNKFVLPVKIKALIINSAQEFTGKKASCEEVKISLLKGLVVRGFNLYDNKKVILTVKEINCSFLFLPLVKKQIIIPRVNIVSASLFLERRTDGTFNVMKPFNGKNPAAAAQAKYNIMVYGVSISAARISFQDDTINPVFTKDLQGVKANLALSLPAKVKFVFSGLVPAEVPMKIAGQGEYNIGSQALWAKVGLKDFLPADFEPYLSGLGVSLVKGKIDYQGQLDYRDQVISSDFTLQTRGLSITRGKLLFILNSSSRVNLKYGIYDERWDISGKTDISQGFVYGLPNGFDQVEKISGSFCFNNEGIFADDVTAHYAQIPFKANITLINFKDPVLSVDLSARPDLEDIQKLAKSNFKTELPCDISGHGVLRLKIENSAGQAQPKIEGVLSTANARVYFPKDKAEIKSITGDINFTSEKIIWNGLIFRFLNTAYKTSGSVRDFTAPQVDLSAASEKSQVDASFKIVSRVIDFSRLAGRYLNSDFSLLGKVDLTDPRQPLADIFGKINLELSEFSRHLKKLKVNLDKLSPQGLVNIQGRLSGKLNDIKNCQAKAALSSTYISLYGLRANNFSAGILLTNAVADMESLHFSLYGGTIVGKAMMNLKNKDVPYWLDLSVQKVDLGKLTADTPMRAKRISGLFWAEMKLSGAWDDPGKISGSGKVSVSNGSLWELDLFKGVGSLVFSNDFRDIIFSEGSCSFVIQNRSIFSDNIKLESPVCLMKGRGKVGFDSSVDVELDAEVSPQAPLTGTFKDVTTAILGNASCFGSIAITGTLKEPKYKFKAAVTNIIQGIADTFWRKE